TITCHPAAFPSFPTRRSSDLLRKIGSFGDPRLYALQLVAEHLAHSSQPLVPERVFTAGSNGENGHTATPSQGMLGMLINLLVARSEERRVGNRGRSRGCRVRS